MNKRIKELCKLCRKVDKTCIDSGAISVGGPLPGQVQLKDIAFFKYFDKYEEDENFGEIYRYFYRNVDNIHFYCLVRKGETYGK